MTCPTHRLTSYSPYKSLGRCALGPAALVILATSLRSLLVVRAEVRRVVEEVTDDKRLPKAERKRLQIEHAPHLSARAKQIKLADKISNVRGVTQAPPADWPLARRQEYLNWTEQVVAGCRGCNAALEDFYDRVLAEGRRVLQR